MSFRAPQSSYWTWTFQSLGTSSYPAVSRRLLEPLTCHRMAAACWSPAGDRVYLVDTSQDQIVAELAPGFVPTNLAVLPDSDTAYVASAGSTLVRTIDLKSSQLSELVRVLPAAPTSLSVGPDSRVLCDAPRRALSARPAPGIAASRGSGGFNKF